MKNIHLKTNIKVRYIHVLSNSFELARPSTDLETLVPPSTDLEESILFPCTNVEEIS